MRVLITAALCTLALALTSACGGSSKSSSECSSNSDCPSQSCVVGACKLTAQIGPDGGTLKSTRVSLSIPAGALSETITVTITPSATESGGKSLVFTVDLAGKTLSSPATLTITVGGDTSQLVMVERASGPIFKLTDNSQSNSDGSVSAPITDGDSYMLAPAPPG